MFKGYVLGIYCHTWNSYKQAYNKAVLDGRIFNKNGRKVTKLL
jgi:phage terminase small subunit